MCSGRASFSVCRWVGLLDEANRIGRVFTPSPVRPCRYFRFFTPLRCAQNDRERGVASFRMTGKGRCAQNDRVSVR